MAYDSLVLGLCIAALACAERASDPFRGSPAARAAGGATDASGADAGPSSGGTVSAGSVTNSAGAGGHEAIDDSVRVWLSTTSGDARLAEQTALTFADDAAADGVEIRVDEQTTYQTMDGFGAALTDTSAWLIYSELESSLRNELMTSLFSASSGIGLSFLRLPMGASDFTKDGTPYSYADAADPTLASFSIAHDLDYIVPALQQALALRPELKILATPWSPPGWMKTSDSMIGGSLRPEYYAAFAQYFVKFIAAYAHVGLPIYAITPQNEPGWVRDYPGLDMTAGEEASFIANDLGPALAAAGQTVKLLAHDWNWADAAVARAVLGDAGAKSFVSGTAWHCYAPGLPTVMSEIKAEFPEKDVYETECSTGITSFRPIDLIIESTRNFARSVLMWNLALNPEGGPKQGTGCPGCSGMVTVDAPGGVVTYNQQYFDIGHVSKFVAPGAVRIYSDPCAGAAGCGNEANCALRNVAFKNPDGSKVLVAHNSGAAPASLRVRWGSKAFEYVLPADAVVTFQWLAPPADSTSGDLVAEHGSALDKAGWQAHASSGAAVQAGIDGDPGTRWTSGKAQQPGDFFQVDLGQVRSLSRVTLDTCQSPDDYPRAYELFLSEDGNDFGPALRSGPGRGGLQAIDFSTSAARFVRVVLSDSTDYYWWSIHELDVYADAVEQ